MSVELHQHILHQIRTAVNAVGSASHGSLKIFVAYSGGMDSAVLLDVLNGCRQEQDFELIALHFDHGFQPESKQWVSFCQQRAAEYGIGFLSHEGAVQVDKKIGLEASARDARYRWLFSQVADSKGVLLTAHHADDQAETLLMNLLRGTGVKGLRGIAGQNELHGCLLIRPLLAFDRGQLLTYAQQQSLNWIDDPSNQDLRFKRNEVRQKMMPVLRELDSSFARQIAKTAGHMQASNLLMEELAEQDLQAIKHSNYCSLDGSYELELGGLTTLSDHRLLNVLQYWLQLVGYPPNSEKDLRLLLTWARQGTTANAILRNGSRIYRYYREHLYVMQNQYEPPQTEAISWKDLGRPLRLNDWSAELVCKQPDKYSATTGVRIEQISVGTRVPLPGNGVGHVDMRKRLQSAGVPPWRRDCALLVFAAEELLAVVGGQQDGLHHPFVLQALK